MEAASLLSSIDSFRSMSDENSSRQAEHEQMNIAQSLKMLHYLLQSLLKITLEAINTINNNRSEFLSIKVLYMNPEKDLMQLKSYQYVFCGPVGDDNARTAFSREIILLLGALDEESWTPSFTLSNNTAGQ